MLLAPVVLPCPESLLSLVVLPRMLPMPPAFPPCLEPLHPPVPLLLALLQLFLVLPPFPVLPPSLEPLLPLELRPPALLSAPALLRLLLALALLPAFPPAALVAVLSLALLLAQVPQLSLALLLPLVLPSARDSQAPVPPAFLAMPTALSLVAPFPGLLLSPARRALPLLAQ